MSNYFFRYEITQSTQASIPHTCHISFHVHMSCSIDNLLVFSAEKIDCSVHSATTAKQNLLRHTVGLSPLTPQFELSCGWPTLFNQNFVWITKIIIRCSRNYEFVKVCVATVSLLEHEIIECL